METKLLFVHAVSPLHAGTGQGVGVIDLPIAREKATQIPFLPGSTLKGVFRDACEDATVRTNVFGPDTGNAELHAGAVTFTDARLLLLPIRSLRGVFAWVTSPLLLRRLARDAKDVKELPALPANIPTPANEGSCLVSSENILAMNTGNGQKVVLEDLPLGFSASPDVTAWAAWLGPKLALDNLNARLCIVSDDVLSFLLETATEISARIRIEDEKKTVAKGQLWYEEALPTETVLVSLVVAANVKSNPQQVFDTVRTASAKTMQFGGKATVGRGLCKATLV
ncbi:MAG: type III-B CRISPR module RAMP protein Cmr4 [Anaerolineales bacterium]